MAQQTDISKMETTETAVELLLEYIEQRINKVNQLDDGSYLDKNIYLSLSKDEFEKIKDKAKAMEKEQIENAYENGSDVNDDLKPLYGTPEEYYNQTYNK